MKQLWTKSGEIGDWYERADIPVNIAQQPFQVIANRLGGFIHVFVDVFGCGCTSAIGKAEMTSPIPRW